MPTFQVKRPFAWRYDGHDFSFDLTFAYGLYSRYHDYNISTGDMNNYNVFRNYTSSTGANWFTHSNEVTRVMVNRLGILYHETYGDDKSLDTLDFANFILGFVQVNWYYSYDDEQYVDGSISDNVDYWCYPMETIYSGCGDCEDTSILYCAIVKAMGYDTALMTAYASSVPRTSGASNHCVSLVAVSGSDGDATYTIGGKVYSFCETTSVGSSVGENPWASFRNTRGVAV